MKGRVKAVCLGMLSGFALASVSATTVHADHDSAYVGLSYGNTSMLSDDRDMLDPDEKNRLGDHTFGVHIGKPVAEIGNATFALEGGFDYHPEGEECAKPTVPSDVDEVVGVASKICAMTTAYNGWVGANTNLKLGSNLDVVLGLGVGRFRADHVLQIYADDMKTELESDDAGTSLNLRGGIHVRPTDSLRIGAEVRYFRYGKVIEPATSVGLTALLNF